MSLRQADAFVKDVFGGWHWYIAIICALYPAFLVGQWLADQLMARL